MCLHTGAKAHKGKIDLHVINKNISKYQRAKHKKQNKRRHDGSPKTFLVTRSVKNRSYKSLYADKTKARAKMHHSKDHIWWLNVCSAATGLYQKTAQCFFSAL